MSTERLFTAAPDMLIALRGNDPDAPRAIRPLAWLRSAIEALRNPERFIEERAEDPDAVRIMIDELEQLFERGSAAISKAEF